MKERDLNLYDDGNVTETDVEEHVDPYYSYGNTNRVSIRNYLHSITIRNHIRFVK